MGYQTPLTEGKKPGNVNWKRAFNCTRVNELDEELIR